MISSLSESPTGVDLRVEKIADIELKRNLSCMGIYLGSSLAVLDREVALQCVRIRGPQGEVVLSGGMGGKIVVHMDDGSMQPLSEMVPGAQGHIEGLTGGKTLADSLAVLGLKNDDRIEFIRSLPGMEYVVSLEGVGRIRLAEGLAAKIIGKMGDITCQFANAQSHASFEVTALIGGDRAQKALRTLGIDSGTKLVLEHVVKARSYWMSGKDRIAVITRDGLRLFLRKDQADVIIVNYDEGE
ncbi:MAG: ferrous iron transport protein A [Desulfovibrio sp.]